MSEMRTTETRVLCVRIDKDLYDQLRRVAFKRFKKFHGALSRAVREALEDYIRKHWTPETPLTRVT